MQDIHYQYLFYSMNHSYGLLRGNQQRPHLLPSLLLVPHQGSHHEDSYGEAWWEGRSFAFWLQVCGQVLAPASSTWWEKRSHSSVLSLKLCVMSLGSHSRRRQGRMISQGRHGHHTCLQPVSAAWKWGRPHTRDHN